MNRDRTVTGAEIRADFGTRTISGVAMPYNEVSPSFRERFLPGSLKPVGDVWLDFGHDVERVLTWRGAGLKLIDGPDAMRFEAQLPRTPLADQALDEVASGNRRGVSVEFNAHTESREPQTGVRVIEDASLRGIALVPRAAYPSASVAEMRNAGRLTGAFNLGVDVPCRCRAECETVQFRPNSLDKALREAARGEREISAFFSGRYDMPIASVGRGLTLAKVDDQLRVSMALPETRHVRDFIASAGAAYYAVRLYVPATSPYRKVGKRAIFGRDTDLRGIEISPITGETDGFEMIDILDEFDARNEQRGVPIWL